MVLSCRRSLAAMVLLMASPFFAQAFRAGISGIVRDVHGAAMPKANVEAVNLETNEVSRTVTDESGYYAIPSLAIGFYRITATAPGFKKAESLLTNGSRETCLTLSIRFPAIRPPKVPNLDFSLFNAFTLHEGVRLPVPGIDSGGLGHVDAVE
jgi:hypothetical protein